MGMAPWRREVSEIVAFLTDCRWVQSEGGRDVLREVTLYNLDAIIAVGYLHDSPNAVVYIVAVWDAPKTGVPVLIDPRRRTPPQ